MRITEYPLIKFTLYFIGGIILEEALRLDFPMSFYLFVASFSLFAVFMVVGKFKTAESLAIVSVILFGVAYNALSLSERENLRFPFQKDYYKKAEIFGKIESAELPRRNSLSLVLVCDSVRFPNRGNIASFRTSVKIRGSEKEILDLAEKISLGDYVEVYAKLMKPRGKRNPGEFDYAEYLRGKKIVALAYCNKINYFRILRKDGKNFRNAIYKLRLKINDAIRTLYSGNVRAIVKALILGEKRDVEKSTLEDFINAGTVHVLAVSGLHIGFIAAIFLLLFGRFGIRLRATLTLLGLLGFVFISGGHPSVVRASIMAAALIFAFISGRDYNPINALAFAAFVLLVINPRELFNPGFQLSFSAVLSILLFYPPLSRFFSAKIRNGAARKILLFLAVSFAAQIGTLPLTLVYFRKLSLIALLTNLFAIPLIGIIVALSIVSVLLYPVSHFLASLYAVSNTFAIDILLSLTRIVARFEYAYVSVPRFELANALLYYAALVFAVYAIARFGTRAKITALLLLALNYALYSEILTKEILPSGRLSVVAIDIGQGDSFLVKFPDETAILIDAGNATRNFDSGARVILPLLEYLGVDSLDALYVSHVDADHYRGSFSIIKSGIVKTVYKPRLDTNMKKDLLFEKFLREQNCDVRYYQRKAINKGGCRIYILNDTTTSVYKSFDMNNRSGILKIVYGSVSVLFTGDLGKTGERFYVNAYDGFLESDVLKAGHHGSKSSTSEIFLRAVKPQYAIISAGIGNKFGHPNFEVLKRLDKFGVEIKRTDRQGAVIFSADGESIEFIEWR